MHRGRTQPFNDRALRFDHSDQLKRFRPRNIAAGDRIDDCAMGPKNCLVAIPFVDSLNMLSSVTNTVTNAKSRTRAVIGS
jgi:hypothetical protein